MLIVLLELLLRILFLSSCHHMMTEKCLITKYIELYPVVISHFRTTHHLLCIKITIISSAGGRPINSHLPIARSKTNLIILMTP